MDWGRAERDLRWNAILSFATLDDIAGESKYFQEQCINYQMEEARKKFKDSAAQATKIERLYAYKERLSELLKWAQSGKEKILLNHGCGSGKAGQQEEMQFWGKMRKRAEGLVETIREILSDVVTQCEDEGDLTMREKAANRKMIKNKKKGQKRKVVRSQKVMMSKEPDVASGKKPRILEMFKNAPKNKKLMMATDACIFCKHCVCIAALK